MRQSVFVALAFFAFLTGHFCFLQAILASRRPNRDLVYVGIFTVLGVGAVVCACGFVKYASVY